MDNISDSEAVILGILCDTPKYGYQIDKIMEDQSVREWTEIAFSSIYYILNKLEHKKLVNSKLHATEKNRTRKIYSITEKGLELLRQNVKEKISKVCLTKWPIDIGLANLDILTSKDIEKHLKHYRNNLEVVIKGYQALKQYLVEQECPVNRLQLADRPILIYQAELEWVSHFISQIKKENNKS